MSLSPSEMRFIKRALQANAPLLFITQHLYTCRELKVEPDMVKLDALGKEIQDFVLGSDNEEKRRVKA